MTYADVKSEREQRAYRTSDKYRAPSRLSTPVSEPRENDEDNDEQERHERERAHDIHPEAGRREPPV
jgi:hypothetical protein